MQFLSKLQIDSRINFPLVKKNYLFRAQNNNQELSLDNFFDYSTILNKYPLGLKRDHWQVAAFGEKN
jgi:hypothetical protein